MKRILIAAIFILPLVYFSVSAQQTERRYPWQYFWQQSLVAYKNKDYQAFLENSAKAVESAQAVNPTLFYNLARAYSLTGNTRQAVEWLGKTLDIGFGAETLAGEDFLFLRGAPEYAALRKRVEQVRKPKTKSRTAATILEPDLIPESIAYDPGEKSFYIGSLHKQKIVRIDREGKASDFIKEGADGLGAVFGIKIDQTRRILWALNNVSPEMRNFDKSREGTAMIHGFDLGTGKITKKYELANQPRPHLLNDLAIAANGDLFFTDSLASEIYALRGGKAEPEVIAALPPYSYPNGIALSADETKLYVANLNGISIIEPKAGKQYPLTPPEKAALAGTDGLYFYENSLIAIQNFESPNRVVRFFLNDRGDRIVRGEVLESNHPLYKIPTTGVIDGRNFYYVANSQLRSFDDSGIIVPINRLQNITILKLKLK